MTRPAEHRHLQSIFTPDEPVIQSHPLLADAVIPRFGQTDVWDFNGVVRRNANLPECQWRARFNKALDDPQWNLTARELAMIMANPRHEACAVPKPVAWRVSWPFGGAELGHNRGDSDAVRLSPRRGIPGT
jgi:hypothetical protein